MAKIVITIEDTADGHVKVASTPTFEVMASMHQSGYVLTSAHGYALRCINVIRELSKQQGPIRALIPRIGKI